MIDLSETLIDPAAPGDIAVSTAERDAIGRSLERLNPDQRIVVVLRFYRDLPVEEIAARVGVPAGTVKSRLHYALRELGVALGGRHPEVAR